MAEPAIRAPGEGELLRTDNRDLRVRASWEQMDMLEYDAGPGYEGPGPHFHKRHVDTFFVLEGVLEFTVGGETVRAGPGTSVSVPPGIVHSFTNPGPGRARFLNVHAPECGFVDFIRARDSGEDVDPEDFDIFDAG
jgi:mannose-6-phosphate isomerase-like protein (cupin superfamily)